MTATASSPLTLTDYRLRDLLTEVRRGVGPDWNKYRVVGATRDGIAPAKAEVGKSPERYKLVRPGTVFYNPMRILIGSIAMVRHVDSPAITSPDYVVVEAVANKLDPTFFYYWLRSEYGQHFIRSNARGAVRERLTFARIADASILVPEIAWQRRFAAIMSDAETLRAATVLQRSSTTDLATSFRDALVEEAFASHPHRQFGDFVTSYRNGFGRRPDGTELGPIVLRLADVADGTINLTSPRRVQMSEALLSDYSLEQDDLLFVRVNGSAELIGRCIFVGSLGEPVSFNDHLIRVRLSEDLDPRFMHLVFSSSRLRAYMAEVSATSAGQRTVNQTMLGRSLIPVPPIEVQTSIVRKLNLAFQQIDAIRRGSDEMVSATESLSGKLLDEAYAA